VKRAGAAFSALTRWLSAGGLSTSVAFVMAGWGTGRVLQHGSPALLAVGLALLAAIGLTGWAAERRRR